MPRAPLQIDFDHHRREAQRLRRQAIAAWLDGLLMTLRRRHRPRHDRPVAPRSPSTRAGEQQCPC